MQEEVNGYERAKAVSEQLKSEKMQKEANEIQSKESAMNELALLQSNTELVKLYNDNAQIGSENLFGNSPYLKVHAAGKSTTNFLMDGKKPNDGWFFYAPTQEQFEVVTCHILTISKGFRTKNQDEKGKEKVTYNQLLGGLMTNGGIHRPFIMFLSGNRLNPMWEFGKIASQWTRMKPISIPMFALTVELTTEEIKTTYGDGKEGLTWIINFSIVKNENGFPKLIMDAGEFQFLKSSVQEIEEVIHSIISKKEIIDKEHVEKIEEVIQGDVVSDDIPF